ncbi:hypothetical protein NKI61_32495, partial [Mesorhizobium sp. M0514]|uniref:hypothetical protein n=1 Tax=Mesorhizobium sp. M0514 TaxID=2956955 RepID=UPI0033350CB2
PSPQGEGFQRYFNQFLMFFGRASGQGESPLILYRRFGCAVLPDRQAYGNSGSAIYGQGGRVGRARRDGF